MWRTVYASILLGLITLCITLQAEEVQVISITPDESEHDIYQFDDTEQLEQSYVVDFPNWFNTSGNNLNLLTALQNAHTQGKQGIIVYFAAPHCPYCEQIKRVVFQRRDIRNYMQTYFDTIGLNAVSEHVLVTPTGEQLTEQDFAKQEDTFFTPSLLFYRYDPIKETGQRVLRLRGYYPPYVFRAALDFVVQHRYHKESFDQYMTQASPLPPEHYQLHYQPWFAEPPHQLQRNSYPARRPLLVLFEQGQCHACDLLHQRHFKHMHITDLLQQMDIVQLDFWDNTPVITPQGKSTTARRWARQLGLFYTPSFLFFDEYGQEILRLDSVVGKHRLHMALQFVLEQGYKQYGSNLIRWYMNKNKHWKFENKKSSTQPH